MINPFGYLPQGFGLQAFVMKQLKDSFHKGARVINVNKTSKRNGWEGVVKHVHPHGIIVAYHGKQTYDTNRFGSDLNQRYMWRNVGKVILVECRYYEKPRLIFINGHWLCHNGLTFAASDRSPSQAYFQFMMLDEEQS